MNLNIRLLIFIVSLFIITTQVSAQDQTTLKIRVDVDSVSLTIDSILTTVDSYGNKLSRNQWFLLDLDSGSYHILFEHPDFSDTAYYIQIDSNEIETIDHHYLQIDSSIQASISILSDPSNAVIEVNGDVHEEQSPTTLELSIGQHNIELYHDQFEPLAYSLEVTESKNRNLLFQLRSLPPGKPEPESLGMVYLPKLPLRDEREADMQKRKFMDLTEMFAIIPLSQGILAKLLLDTEQQNTADALIISGVVLTAGSFILGNILSKRKLNIIREYNETTTANNKRADIHNKDVDRSIRDTHNQLMIQWEEENNNRGIVISTSDTTKSAP